MISELVNPAALRPKSSVTPSVVAAEVLTNDHPSGIGTRGRGTLPSAQGSSVKVKMVEGHPERRRRVHSAKQVTQPWVRDERVREERRRGHPAYARPEAKPRWRLVNFPR